MTHTIKSSVVGLSITLVALAFLLAPQQSHAQYSDSTGAVYESKIAALKAYIEELRELLELFKQLKEARFGAEAKSFNVATQEASTITDTTARLRGRVTFGNAESLTAWFELGTDEDELDTATTKEELSGVGSEEYTRNVAGLDPDTDYYYRAVAESPSGAIDWGIVQGFTTDDEEADTELPVAETHEASRIGSGDARLNGEVNMNEYENGVVFFVYGKDEDEIASIADDYDEKDDVPNNPDEIDVVDADNELDGQEEYSEFTDGPKSETKYFYTICVEYEDDDNDEHLSCGDVESFETASK